MESGAVIRTDDEKHALQFLTLAGTLEYPVSILTEYSCFAFAQI